MLDYAFNSLHLLHHQRMSLYAFDMQQRQYYADFVPPSPPPPPPIQVPSQQRPPQPELPGSQSTIFQRLQSQQQRQDPPSVDQSPASSNSQSFSHNGSPMPISFDQEPYSVPFLADWSTPPWPPEIQKHHPSSLSHQQARHTQNNSSSMNGHLHPLTQSMPHPNGFNPQPTSLFSADLASSFDGNEFASSLFLASPPNSVRSDDSVQHSSREQSSPMIAHSPPSISLATNMTIAYGVPDLNPVEAVGIKHEKELSPQASYDPRFLTSNPAPITDASPRQTFNGLFNPTEPPVPIQQDTSESSSLESSEEDPSGTYIEPVVPSQMHETEHGSRLHRSPRLAAPVPIPNLTKKSRGRRVPTQSLVTEDGVSKDRPFACTVPDCGKVWTTILKPLLVLMSLLKVFCSW
jgi:hypothetical protein